MADAVHDADATLPVESPRRLGDALTGTLSDRTFAARALAASGTVALLLAAEPPALKAWFYPTVQMGHEFVYSKDEARTIAKAAAEVAERVGYGSASTFSTAFSRRTSTAALPLRTTTSSRDVRDPTSSRRASRRSHPGSR